MTCNHNCANCRYDYCIDNKDDAVTDEERERRKKERWHRYGKQYRATHKEEIALKKKCYRQEHKAELAEKKRIYDKKYRAEHKEKLHQREVIRWQKIKAARAAAMGATSNV